MTGKHALLSLLYMNIIKKSRRFLWNFRQFYKKFLKDYTKELGYCHETADLRPPLVIKGSKNVFLYEDTGIRDAIIMATNAKYIMKKHSGAAEGLCVITGNHERKIGRFYRTISENEKTKGLDKDVIVEEDCWIGANVTLLSGVTIRRGTTIASGAVVNKSSAPYSVIGGVPARHIKFYWTIEEILQHEKMLYNKDERYTREELENFFSKHN